MIKLSSIGTRVRTCPSCGRTIPRSAAFTKRIEIGGVVGRPLTHVRVPGECPNCGVALEVAPRSFLPLLLCVPAFFWLFDRPFGNVLDKVVWLAIVIIAVVLTEASIQIRVSKRRPK